MENLKSREKTASTQYNNPYIERINYLSQLDNNWDNNGGYAPFPEVVNNMIGLIEYWEKEFPEYLKLSPPQDIYPFHRGTLAIDWHVGYEVVIHIEVGKTSILCMVTPEGQFESKPYYYKKTQSEELINSVSKKEKWQEIFNRLNQR